jgi:AraC-like DNA-binding protein
MNEINLYAYGRNTAQGKWHIDYNRIVNRLYYVNSGSAVIFNGADEYRLESGNAYIIPQCKAFQPVNAFDFDHTYFDFYSSKVLNPSILIKLDKNEIESAFFFEFINTLIEKGNKKEDLKAMEVLLSGFLSVIDNNCGPLPYITNPLITNAINIIYNGFSTTTTKEISEKLNINESYLVRLFSSIMGISPMKYIRALRISHGKELLKNGCSISDVAEKCGYSSSSSFYNAVKAELGITPSELKKLN